jgi:hypothetical protein
MKTDPTMVCDRCGAPRSYLSLNGNNGMIAWGCDLCLDCFKDMKKMLLYREHRDNPAKRPDPDA